jgi:hypothetical protein
MPSSVPAGVARPGTIPTVQLPARARRPRCRARQYRPDDYRAALRPTVRTIVHHDSEGFVGRAGVPGQNRSAGAFAPTFLPIRYEPFDTEGAPASRILLRLNVANANVLLRHRHPARGFAPARVSSGVAICRARDVGICRSFRLRLAQRYSLLRVPEGTLRRRPISNTSYAGEQQRRHQDPSGSLVLPMPWRGPTTCARTSNRRVRHHAVPICSSLL